MSEHRASLNEAALNAWFASVKARLDLLDASLSLLIARVELLEQERALRPAAKGAAPVISLVHSDGDQA